MDVMQNWGSKPFRVLNCWFQNPSFRKFVEDFWSNLQVHGRSAYVFKEKLKLLKSGLKRWNTKVFGDMNLIRQGLLRKLNDLDVLAKNTGLT